MIIYATKQIADRYEIEILENFQDLVMRQIALDVYNYEKDHPLVCFAKLTDRKTISTMSRFQSIKENGVLNQ